MEEPGQKCPEPAETKEVFVDPDHEDEGKESAEPGLKVVLDEEGHQCYEKVNEDNPKDTASTAEDLHREEEWYRRDDRNSEQDNKKEEYGAHKKRK